MAAAKEMEDLESRLQGSASSASRQRLGDAAAAIDKERIEVAELKKKEKESVKLKQDKVGSFVPLGRYVRGTCSLQGEEVG